LENRKPFYLLGADIDANDLRYIGILDIVTITNGYGKAFGKPPD